MSKITDLISIINNENISVTKKICKGSLTKNGAELCKILYKEGVIESFSVDGEFLIIGLNKKLQKKKVVKHLDHKKLKTSLTFKEIVKLKDTLYPFIMSCDRGMSTTGYLKRIRKGGIVKYKIL